MPNPKPSENQEEWIARCMGDATSVADFPSTSQRYAVCISKWRNRTKDENKNNVEVTEMSDSIKEIQSAIADALSNSASKAELQQLQAQFMERLNNKSADHNDIDAILAKQQSAFEAKMAEMFEQQKKSAFGGQAKKESFGDFLVKARNNDVVLREMTRKALSENTGADGGYIVPEEFMAEVQRVQLEQSVVRANGARVINMNSNILKVPALNIASNASGSIFGGVSANWTGESKAITASAPKFKQVTLEAKKLVGYVESSDELDNDSIVSMGGLLQDLFTQTINFEEDSAFLTGNGVGKPLGIINAPATVAVTRTTASKVGTVDLVNMLARFYRKGGSPVWIINQSVLPEIYKLKDENSNYILLPGMQSSIAGALPNTIYGIPVIVTEKVPALGTSGDIILADMRYYLIGDRQRITVDESMHVKFSTDEKAWRFVTRVDGQPWIDSAITPRAGGSTLSPFVKLT